VIASRAAFKDCEVTYNGPSMASNNTKSIGKSIGVIVLPLLCISIGIGNTFSAKYWYYYWHYFLKISLTSLTLWNEETMKWVI